MKIAVAFVVDQLEARPDGLIAFRDVQRAIGITDRRNFNRQIRKSEDFIEALSEHGIVEFGGGDRPTGFANEGATFDLSDAAA